MVLVDTNVLIDILVKDRVWLNWSAEQLDRCRRSDRIFTNEVGYAELAARIDSQAALENALENLGIALERMPTAALFAAGQAYSRYRAAGGPRLNVLADFFLGAHAQSLRISILTRDVRRYRTYFPDVKLIAP